MRQLSLLFCLMVALGLIVIVAFFSTEGPSLMLSLGTTQAERNSTFASALLANSSHWTDPAWQRTTSRTLSTLNMAVVIRDTKGHTLYHAGTYDQNEPVFQELVVMDGMQQRGTAFIYDCTPTVRLTQRWLLVGLIVLLLTLA